MTATKAVRSNDYTKCTISVSLPSFSVFPVAEVQCKEMAVMLLFLSQVLSSGRAEKQKVALLPVSPAPAPLCLFYRTVDQGGHLGGYV